MDDATSASVSMIMPTSYPGVTPPDNEPGISEGIEPFDQRLGGQRTEKEAHISIRSNEDRTVTEETRRLTEQPLLVENDMFGTSPTRLRTRNDHHPDRGPDRFGEIFGHHGDGALETGGVGTLHDQQRETVSRERGPQLEGLPTV